MNTLVLMLGLLSLLLFFVHLIAGGRECLAPVRASDAPVVAREVLHVCWHAVSFHLLAGAGAFIAAASLWEESGITLLVGFVGLSWLAYAALFIALGARVRAGWKRMPQWTFFLPMGLAATWLAFSA